MSNVRSVGERNQGDEIVDLRILCAMSIHVVNIYSLLHIRTYALSQYYISEPWQIYHIYICVPTDWTDPQGGKTK